MKISYKLLSLFCVILAIIEANNGDASFTSLWMGLAIMNQLSYMEETKR